MNFIKLTHVNYRGEKNKVSGGEIIINADNITSIHLAHSTNLENGVRTPVLKTIINLNGFEDDCEYVTETPEQVMAQIYERAGEL